MSRRCQRGPEPAFSCRPVRSHGAARREYLNKPVLSRVLADLVVGRFQGSEVSSRPVIDVSALRLWLLTVTSWLDRQEREILAYLIEENRVLRQAAG
jgi:hypothetical protein